MAYSKSDKIKIATAFAITIPLGMLALLFYSEKGKIILTKIKQKNKKDDDNEK